MATVSTKDILRRVVRRLGGQTGTFVSGSATTAILGSHIGLTGDDAAFQGDRLIFFDADNADEVERYIEQWEDSVGQATFATRLADDYDDATYALVNREDYTLGEMLTALALALSKTTRTYRHVIPATPDKRFYPLAMDWLSGDGDVDAVWLCGSPNMLANEDFGLWQDGGSSAPDGWTLAGAAATVARVAGMRSAYGVEVTRAGADATLYQSIPESLLQYLTRSTNVRLDPIKGGAWVNCVTASRARVGIWNGSSTAWSDYHAGDGVMAWLPVSYQPDGTETDLRLVLSVDTGDVAAEFHAAVLMSGRTLPDVLKDVGSQAYGEYSVAAVIRNAGGAPMVELPYATGGQLIVYSRRRLPTMTALTDTVDDRYEDAIVSGTLRFLLEGQKPNQDRTRLDVVMGQEARKWTAAMENFIDIPVPEPFHQTVVRGA